MHRFVLLGKRITEKLQRSLVISDVRDAKHLIFQFLKCFYMYSSDIFIGVSSLGLNLLYCEFEFYCRERIKVDLIDAA